MRMKTLCTAMLLLVLCPAVARAQFFPSFPSGSTQNPSAPQNIFQTATITLDGVPLFRIAAPAAAQAPQAPLEIQTRVSSVEAALAQLVATTGTEQRTVYDPLTLQVQVAQEGRQAVIEAFDAAHPAPLPVVTVTSADAKYHQTTVSQLAAQWQRTTYNALYQALMKRQPATQRRSFDWAVRAGIALLILTAILLLILRSVRERIAVVEKRLAERQTRLAAERTAEHAEVRPERERQRRTLALSLRLVKPLRGLSAMHALAALLIWIVVLVWFVFLTWALYLFPQTTPLAHDIAAKTVRIVAIWIVAMLGSRLLDVAIVRLVGAWLPVHYGMSSEERARQSLRVPTTIRAISGFKSVIIVLVAIAWTIAQLGLPIAGVVTFGGVAALAISFAAQNFLRDFLSGFLVIFEDQYAIGDFITINGSHSGIVEHLTLRMVQLRDTAGNLITIGHGSVTSVLNRSRNWSRVDYRVAIDPSSDVEEAVAILVDTIQELAKASNYRADILDAVEWAGVDAMSRDWIVLRASIRTAPLRQFEVRRELNLRVVERFKAAGIKFGAPVIDQAQTTQP